MQVKAQALFHATRWIEETYGQDSLRDVLRACSPEVRDRYISAIAINWHPQAELMELIEHAERLLGRGDGRIAEQIGAAGARSNMKGTFVRLAFYLTKPDFLLRRITQLWRQFNDAGAMDLLHIDDYSASIAVRDLPDPSWLFCCTITGWAKEVVIALGGKNPSAKHTSCVAKGDERCIWRMHWTQTAVSDVAARAEAAVDARRPSSSAMPSARPAAPSTPPPSKRRP